MISCLGATTRHLLMPRDPFQLQSSSTKKAFLIGSVFYWLIFLELGSRFSLWVIRLEKLSRTFFSRQSGLDRVSRQSNQQLIRPIKKAFLVEEDCISFRLVFLNKNKNCLDFEITINNFRSWVMSGQFFKNFDLWLMYESCICNRYIFWIRILWRILWE